MATLRIDITAPNAALLNYAEDLGYSDTVTTGFDGENQPITEPNPVSASQYLTEKIKGIVSVALANKSIQIIEQTKREEARTEAVNTRTAIEGAMTVSIL